MNSCLYKCSVMHHRFAPKVHHFNYELFMFYLDLDELDAVAGEIFFFSRNRRNLYNFCDTDHEPAGKNALKDRVLDFLLQNNIDPGPGSRVMLLTLPRFFGYVFNPVSIYFCFNQGGQPVCSVAEVGNTFLERKLFLLGRKELQGGNVFKKIVPKHFYVSPFSPLDLNFDFRLGIPGDRLNIEIDDREGDARILLSSLTGKHAPLTNKNLFWFTVKYPFITLKVILLIHWQAFRLWLKRVPFYRKSENSPLQREVLRPHSTLLGKAK